MMVVNEINLNVYMPASLSIAEMHRCKDIGLLWFYGINDYEISVQWPTTLIEYNALYEHCQAKWRHRTLYLLFQ